MQSGDGLALGFAMKGLPKAEREAIALEQLRLSDAGLCGGHAGFRAVRSSLPICKPGSTVVSAFKFAPEKVTDVVYKFHADKGYNLCLDVFAEALSRVEIDPRFPPDLQPPWKNKLKFS